MKRYLLIFFLGWQSVVILAQQDSLEKPVYFEKAPQGLVRFFFDSHYFLVDKHCTFKSIERLSQFDIANNVFHGEFKDFGTNGKMVLTGYYEEGIKQGVFKAYHPNGILKWEVTFEDNKPIGPWNYYYPDGKPMLSVDYAPDITRIVSYWDRKGRQRITDGNGTYVLRIPFAFYNEYGYPFFERKGKLRNGLPTGYWTTYAVDDKGHKELMTEEVYNTPGILSEGYNLFEDMEYDAPRQMLPTSFLVNAETLTFKQCNFDDFSGFNTYLADFLKKMFPTVPNFANRQDDFAYSLSLDKNGIPKDVSLSNTLSNDELNTVFAETIEAIPFYFPSLNQIGEPIADKLSVSGKLLIDANGRFDFHSIRIDRENQSQENIQ